MAKDRANDPKRMLHTYLDKSRGTSELVVRNTTIGPIFGAREMGFGGHGVKEAENKFLAQEETARKEKLNNSNG